MTDPNPDRIAERAYFFYLERGGVDGHDVEDWLRAEQELMDEETPTLHVVAEAGATTRRRRTSKAAAEM